MKNLNHRAKRYKQRGTPGRRLLSNIIPYSTFALHLDLPPVACPTDQNGNPVNFDNKEMVEEWYRNRNAGELAAQVRLVCFKPAFAIMSSEQTVYSLCKYARTLFGHPEVFENVPTIGTFEHDIKTYKKICEKYPGLISEAHELLSEKYNRLIDISDDYLDWRSWLYGDKVIRDTIVFDPPNSDCRQELQSKSIQYADAILRSIPPEKDLRNGRARLIGMRWFIENVAFQWKCCTNINYFDEATENKFALFYAFLIQLINAVYEVVPPEYRESVQRVVKTDDESIKKVARIVLYKRDVYKRWNGSPNTHTLFIGSACGRGFLYWVKIVGHRLRVRILENCKRMFFQPGYLKAHLAREIRNWKKYR